jgi:hypothetical protein
MPAPMDVLLLKWHLYFFSFHTCWVSIAEKNKNKNPMGLYTNVVQFCISKGTF